MPWPLVVRSDYVGGMSLLFRGGVAALVVSTLALAGCAITSPVPAAPAPAPTPTPEEPAMEIAATWLDAGRMIGLVTWGSSSCVPFAEEPAADGQKIAVKLTDADTGPCTADHSPRASELAVPAGVDPTQPVTVQLTYLDQTAELTLPGDTELTGTPGDPTDYQPSAGWFSDNGIVLLTWGSSTCRPQVSGIEETADGITVTFTAHEGMCTMDMAPRTTILGVEQVGRDRPLTLVGDNLDATIPIRG